MADTRTLSYTRRGEPLGFVRGSTDARDLRTFRRGELVGPMPAGSPQTVTAGAIASVEVFGDLNASGPISGLGAIASAEAFGTAGLGSELVVTVQGADSVEAFGTPDAYATITVTGGGIVSEERFGGPADPGRMGIYRRREPLAFLLPRVSARETGIPRSDGIVATISPIQGRGAAIELRNLSYVTALGAIASREAFGTPKVAGPISSLGGIASREAFGTLVVTASSPPRRGRVTATVTRYRVPTGLVGQ